jgi:hypothetical protein
VFIFGSCAPFHSFKKRAINCFKVLREKRKMTIQMTTKLALLFGLLAPSALGQSKITNPQETGNCVSGRIYFNAERAYNMKTAADKVNPEDHDIVIEYGAANTLVCLVIFKSIGG